MSQPCLLIADIGGTNARFALADAATGGYGGEIEYRCADFTSVQDAITHYLNEAGAGTPLVICLAVAAPTVDDPVHFTNSDWSISCKELKQQFGVTEVRLLNDFEAIALAMPTLKEDERLQIGTQHRADLCRENFTIGVLGPGTGLGGSGLARRDGRDAVLVTEAGHGSMAAENAIQQDIITLLKQEYGRVSYERLLSGPGIENIYRCLRQIRGAGEADASASRIGEKALSGEDDIAVETLGIFFEMLGQVAGDFALMIGAFDGIFIAGGIARRYTDLLQHSGFRNGFENKGRYQSLMKNIPTELITHPQPGLQGASISAINMVPVLT